MPAQRVDELRERLRLLAVEAQPASTPMLAIDEEGEIRHPFQPLIDAQLIEVDVLARATPDCLHEMVLV
jgi:hypothetical protein